jgi:hypothetical protein
MFGRKQAMKLGNTKFEAGNVTFALQYRALMPDQGVSLQVASCAGGEEKELLRFDCFDQRPHYHYDPEDKNLHYDMDKTTAGNPVGWTLQQLRTRLPEMLKKAGFEEIANNLDCPRVLSTLDQVEEAARYMAQKQRRTVTHNRGDVVIEAGNIRFGLEFRELTGDRGMAIHVLSDVAPRRSNCWPSTALRVGRTTITDRATRMFGSTGTRRWSPIPYSGRWSSSNRANCQA